MTILSFFLSNLILKKRGEFDKLYNIFPKFFGKNIFKKVEENQ